MAAEDVTDTAPPCASPGGWRKSRRRSSRSSATWSAARRARSRSDRAWSPTARPGGDRRPRGRHRGPRDPPVRGGRGHLGAPVGALADKLRAENGIAVDGRPASSSPPAATWRSSTRSSRSPTSATRSSSRRRTTSITRWRSAWPAAARCSSQTDDAYQLRLDAIAKAITPRTRAVVTVSPNNPTGAVYPRAGAARGERALPRARASFTSTTRRTSTSPTAARGRSRPARSRAARAHTISLYSFSKAYGFAGWRIGYMVIPASLDEAVRKIQDTILICPPVIAAGRGARRPEGGRGVLPGQGPRHGRGPRGRAASVRGDRVVLRGAGRPTARSTSSCGSTRRWRRSRWSSGW